MNLGTTSELYNEICLPITETQYVLDHSLPNHVKVSMEPLFERTISERMNLYNGMATPCKNEHRMLSNLNADSNFRFESESSIIEDNSNSPKRR